MLLLNVTQIRFAPHVVHVVHSMRSPAQNLSPVPTVVNTAQTRINTFYCLKRQEIILFEVQNVPV